ncbi:hypothetical protein BC829DRAFT_421173 [Chytridium lagenaria]|nr:hypothetical protein BC829DRAFT_421173 [Chytridium lagenaria]
MSTPPTKKTTSNMVSTPSSTPASIEESMQQYINIISRMDTRMEDLLLEVKALREDNARLQKRLDDKDAEIHRLNRQALGPTNQTAPVKIPTVPAPVEDNGMEHEDGEVIEDLSATKLAAFKADLTKTVVAELLVAMKEEGFPRPTPTAYARRLHHLPFRFAAVSAKLPEETPLLTTPLESSLGAPILVVKSWGYESLHAGIRPKRPQTLPYGQKCPSGYWHRLWRNGDELHWSISCSSHVDSSKAAAIEKKLTDKGVLIPAFDPLEVPKLNVASSKSLEEREKEGRINCAKRLGALYSRGGQQIKKACLEVLTKHSPTKSESKHTRILTNVLMSDVDEHHIIRLGFWNAQGLTDIDLMAIVETWLAPTDGIPLKRVVVNGTAPPRNRHVDGKATGRKGQWGVLVMSPGEKEIGLEVLGVDTGGKWTAVKVGILVIIVGYLPPMAVMAAGTSKGKWTTHARNGNGITDFVFLNTAALPLAPDLVVHEDTTMGSDHSFAHNRHPTTDYILETSILRINISKLEGEGCVRFRDRLKEGRQDVMTKLGFLEVRAAGRSDE